MAIGSPGPKESDFDRLLREFVSEMRAKFRLRHEKQHARGNKSVLDPGFDFSNDLSEFHVLSHFNEEIRERLEAVGDGPTSDEDVDVANMAFLDWAMRRERIRRMSNP